MLTEGEKEIHYCYKRRGRDMSMQNINVSNSPMPLFQEINYWSRGHQIPDVSTELLNYIARPMHNCH